MWDYQTPVQPQFRCHASKYRLTKQQFLKGEMQTDSIWIKMLRKLVIISISRTEHQL